MIKRILAMAMVATIMVSTGTQVEAKQKPIKTVVISEKKLTWNMLEHRKGKNIQYVEVVKGKVTSKKKDGKSYKGYISYRGVKGCHKGDKITTYLVYNPYTNYTDDIIERWDYITYCPHHK